MYHKPWCKISYSYLYIVRLRTDYYNCVHYPNYRVLIQDAILVNEQRLARDNFEVDASRVHSFRSKSIHRLLDRPELLCIFLL